MPHFHKLAPSVKNLLSQQRGTTREGRDKPAAAKAIVRKPCVNPAQIKADNTRKP
jgi:hypothetical protein